MLGKAGLGFDECGHKRTRIHRQSRSQYTLKFDISKQGITLLIDMPGVYNPAVFGYTILFADIGGYTDVGLGCLVDGEGVLKCAIQFFEASLRIAKGRNFEHYRRIR